MKFGVFFLCEQPPWQSQRSAYADALDQAFYADALGFDTVWLSDGLARRATCPGMGSSSMRGIRAGRMARSACGGMKAP